jgi:UDP-glucuronate decarboxylase
MMTGGARQTAVVAGGAGFVGSHLCDHLIAEGYRVVCVDSLLTSTLGNLDGVLREPRFSFIEHDVINPLPRGMMADVVFNLACAASPRMYQLDPVHTMMTNVVGTNNLLSFAGEQGARFLQASTSEVYGNPEVHPQPESYAGNVNPTGPRACYDEGKRAAETLCFDYLRQGVADVRVARIFNTYGPRLRESDGRVVSNMISQALAGDPVTVYGDGSQTRSFCYVEDLIDGLTKLMRHESALPHPINLGNPAELRIAEVAKVIHRMTASGSQIVFCPLPVDDPCRRRPDVRLARETLGWQPRIGLEDGLRRTIDWFAATMRPPAFHDQVPDGERPAVRFGSV